MSKRTYTVDEAMDMLVRSEERSSEPLPAPERREPYPGEIDKHYMGEQIAALKAENATLRESLDKLSARLEREIVSADGPQIWWLPDNACAECVPDGGMVKEGFQCCRHAARAALAHKEPK